jgi:hypothetical protein
MRLPYAGLIAIACVLAVAGCHRKAKAHDHGSGSWINHQQLKDPQTGQWCCDERDTREENDNIRAVEGGYLIISTGEVIPKERVIWRSPGGWWRSRNLSDGTTRCLIGPPQGS